MKKCLNRLTAVGLILVAASSWANFSFEGAGIFSGGRLFHIRGVNLGHTWHPERTERALADIAATGANTVRIALSNGGQWTRNNGTDVANVIELCKANSLICMLEVHDTTGWGDDSNAVHISSAADYWTSPDILEAITGEEDYVLINIANAPFGGDVSHPTYVEDTTAAIRSLRDAGITHALVVDAPDWGQDSFFISVASQMAGTGADPLGKLIFGLHMYENYPDYDSVMRAVYGFRQTGLPLVVVDFGPERNGSPVDVDTIISQAYLQLRGFLDFGLLGSSWSGKGDALDLVFDWDPENLTPWGERLFNGPYGITRAPMDCANVYPSCWPGGSSSSSSGGQTGSSTSSSSSGSSSSTTSSSSSGGGGALECTVGDVTDWGEGFVLNDLNVTNTGSQPVSHWTVQLQFSQPVTVSNAWNIGLTSTSGSLLTGTNASYNGSLQPGRSANFGMQGAPGGLGTVTCTAE